MKLTADSVDARQQNNRSPELPQTMTKTEAVMQDVRRLKSAALGRMGRMFKTRTLNEGTSSLGPDTVSDSVPRGVVFYKCKERRFLRDGARLSRFGNIL